jgi:hypothetical protein
MLRCCHTPLASTLGGRAPAGNWPRSGWRKMHGSSHLAYAAMQLSAYACLDSSQMTGSVAGFTCNMGIAGSKDGAYIKAALQVIRQITYPARRMQDNSRHATAPPLIDILHEPRSSLPWDPGPPAACSDISTCFSVARCVLQFLVRHCLCVRGGALGVACDGVLAD